LDDDIIDGCHDEADLSSVGGAGEMCVNLLGLVLVQADETVQNVITGQSVIIPSFVVWEVILHWADGQLLLESIDLVQEQDNRCLNEPPRVADGVKEGEGLLHTIDSLVFEE